MTGKNDNSTQSNSFQFHAWNKDRLCNFENFFQTEKNKTAYQAAQAVAMQLGVYNPLYIYGPICTGKTFLLCCIEDFIRKHSPSVSVLHVTAEEFLIEMVDAVKKGDGTAVSYIQRKYRSRHVLLMDDIQTLCGNRFAMDEFVRTFNALYDCGRQIVMTGNCSPKEMEGLDERFRARLTFGMTVEIGLPYKRKGLLSLIEKSQEVSGDCGRGHGISTDDEEEDGLDTAGKFSRSLLGMDIHSYLKTAGVKRKKSPKQVNYRQACRTFMEHPDIIVKLFYRGLDKEISLLFREGRAEDIQRMRKGEISLENDGSVGPVYGKYLDGHIHYCHAYVKGSRVYFLYDSREGVAAMYRTKSDTGSGSTWLYYGKYTPEDGKVSFIFVAESPKKEKEIRDLLLGRFRDEEAGLLERKNVAKPEEAEGSAVPEETAFHLILKYWDQILDKVRTNYGVSDIPWRLWLCPLKPVEMRKRELYIVCGMDIGTTMAERKYSGMIRDAVEQVTGIQIEPVFLPPEKLEIDDAEMMEYIKKLKEAVPDKAARFLLSDLALRYF